MAVMTRQPADWTDRAPLKIELREICYPQDVWDVLCDHERWPEWFSALDKAEATGGTGLGSTRTVWVAKKPIHEEFIVWDEPRSWGFSVVEAEGRSVSSPRRSTSGSTSRFSPMTEFGSPT